MTARYISLALLLLAVGPAGASSRSAGEMELVQIEANEGSSSGGHLALRFGDEVYHFQHHDPGILRLRRDTWERFRHQYGDLDNRALTRHRIAGEPRRIAALRDDFASLLFTQRKQLDSLRDAEDDAALLSRLEPGARDIAAPIAAAGFFATAPHLAAAEPAPECSALAGLRRRAAKRHGGDFVAETKRAALARARALGEPSASSAIADRRDYPHGAGLHRQLSDAWSEIVAFTILERAPCLSEGVVIEAGATTPADRARLAERAGAIESQLLELLASPRPDRGYPLLVGMARLLALEASASGRELLVLDAFPDDDGEHTLTIRRANVRAALVGRSRAELDAARSAFLDGDYDEAELSDLEAAATRFAALRDNGDNRLRAYRGNLTPTRSATWTDLPVPPFSTADLDARRGSARQHADGLAAQIRALWDYDLIERNCATELFRQIRAEAPELADEIAPDWLEFLPAHAGRAAARSFRVTDVERMPSLHERWLADRPGGGALAESMTWTSRLYRDWSSDDDSIFLFFARDPAPLRPIFGIANLATGIGATIAGLPLAPFDRGKLVTAGARGAVFSVPELFWINIRKGSFAYVDFTTETQRTQRAPSRHEASTLSRATPESR